MSKARIEITKGMVDWQEHFTDAGRRPVLDMIGREVFFIDMVEEDGSRLNLWIVDTYEKAIFYAESAAHSEGYAVDDLVLAEGK
ncbi:hypothetical protein [Salipiger mucosus]|uniref:Uncharacterized protein n=1 Tax=Salipiger mucosus DSM 16094 TaxID=1123237 RepID=S9SGE8_9RHOB|nr:hypothetical protein [Salipiger mucosus]EPX85374.1 hypothetical protein Salmuc_02754 [Salipiger mucosus DSM 16094]